MSDSIQNNGDVSNPVRFGVIGGGWVASDRHIPSLMRLKSTELVVVYDRSIDRARTAAPDGVVATSSLDDFFAHDLDAVCICTSPWSHAELTVAAVEHGLHVLCEKPMALNESDATTMVDAAAKADRLLCISHNFLWSDAMQRALDTIADSGDLRYAAGVQLSSEGRRLPSWYQDLDGGLLFDEIPHMLYILDRVLGSPLVVEDVRVEWADREFEPQVCEVRLRGQRAPGQITMVFGSPVSEWHVASVAERNVVDVDLFRDVMVATGSDGAHTAREVLTTSARVAGGHLFGFAKAGVRLARHRQYWGHDGLIDAFATAVRSGGPSPVPTDSALSVVRATDTIIEAISRR
jgi:scyllo-inositol 2-dehydrogenase (NADP+)